MNAQALLALLFTLYATLASAQTAEIAASVVDDKGQPVADAIVVAVPVDGNMRLPEHPHGSVIDQVDKEFSPKVIAVVAGTPVSFPNKDNVRHHVYSFSPGWAATSMGRSRRPSRAPATTARRCLPTCLRARTSCVSGIRNWTPPRRRRARPSTPRAARASMSTGR